MDFENASDRQDLHDWDRVLVLALELFLELNWLAELVRIQKIVSK